VIDLSLGEVARGKLIEVLVTEMLRDAGVRLPGARREALRRQADANGIVLTDAVLASLDA
jgi:(2R)-3-sulfolactate dehydrogenase (NADP+)